MKKRRFYHNVLVTAVPLRCDGIGSWIMVDYVSGTRMHLRRVNKWVGLDCNQSACAMCGNIILQTSEVHVHNYVCEFPKLIKFHSVLKPRK